MSTDNLDPESGVFESQETRPSFCIGQHDSSRFETLSEEHYSQVLNLGFNFATSPITNRHFQNRVIELYKAHTAERQAWQSEGRVTESQSSNPSLPGLCVPALTDKDTSLFPTSYIGAVVAYSSPWIDLCSPDAAIASISRQVLNLEVAYANFCGIRSIIVPGPRHDGSGREVHLYARAIQEALIVAVRANIIIHMPMYREPGLEEFTQTLTTTVASKEKAKADEKTKDIDLFGAWDAWNTVRSFCEYSLRLFVAVRIPRRLPEKNLQTRWFSEPLHYLTLGPNVFQANKAGLPSLSRHHQDLINDYMRLKNAPWLILHDIGPDLAITSDRPDQMHMNFPSLSESSRSSKESRKPFHVQSNPHLAYMRHVERHQPPYSEMESATLTSFQDWLQSPLQPLADNLESATYEVFEGDPVKYDQYEMALIEAMNEWKELKKPTSALPNNAHPDEDLIVTVAGAGRGPLVTRVIHAAERTGTKIQLWAVEKNQNAYVYLLRQNERIWNGKVKVVKTDMRGWEGPRPKSNPDVTTKVDILVTELLGSFGDNELSPECLDGIQRHLAKPHGISIPHSYTAHLSPISTPRIYADIRSRLSSEPNGFEIPWVVRLFQYDFVAEKVPGHPRFQQTWEFVHPVGVSRADDFAAKHGLATKFVTDGVGSMSGGTGTNEHNARYAQLTFVCRAKGVIHGLAGYFESVLYASQVSEDREPVELSIRPDQIDRKSKDMISWFPIFFPLKQPLYFPPDAELEVSMWRQTDDTQIWYEWIVDAYVWVGPETRVKVGGSELHSSKKVACLM